MINFLKRSSKKTKQNNEKNIKGESKTTCGSVLIDHEVVVNTGSSRGPWKGNLKLQTKCSSADMDETEDTRSMTSSEFATDIVYSNPDKNVFSFYQVGDGSAEDLDHIPQRYLDMADQDVPQAMENMQKTLQWREEENIDQILNKPHVNFDICKQAIPQYFMGRDAKGNPVFLQRPALLDMDLARANGVDYDDLLHHAIYVQEYLWQIIERENPMALVTNIIDVGDLNFSDFRKQKDRLAQLLRIASIFDAHYPCRASKTIVVNAPSWFGMLFKLIKPVMREKSAEMIAICSKGKEQDDVLKDHLGQEASKSLPDYCWSKPQSEGIATPLDQQQMEKELRAFVMNRIEARGETMKPVLV